MGRRSISVEKRVEKHFSHGLRELPRKERKTKTVDAVDNLTRHRQPGNNDAMKPAPRIKRMIHAGIALAIALAFCLPSHVQSVELVDVKTTTENQMMAQCEEMKAQKKKMKDDAKAQDAELTEQISKMNSASEDKKIALMAAVITHMTEQRIAMDARKAKMEEEVMKHMMQHMQMDKDSMSKCPMMKGMKEIDEKSNYDHKDHY